MGRMHRRAGVLFVLLSFWAIMGCATTMSKAMNLDENMTRDQVRAKLGYPKALSKISKANGEVWESWDYPQSSFNPLDAYDTRVIFVNGKLREWGRSSDISIR